MHGSIAQNADSGCTLFWREKCWCGGCGCSFEAFAGIMADGRGIYAGLAGVRTISVKGWFLVIQTRNSIWMRVVPLVLAIVALAFLTACGTDAAEPEPAEEASTALANLSPAESAVATLAADAKLLVVQAPSASADGADPLWVFLFGSPETGQMFSVSIVNGVVMNTAAAGAAPLESAEWASVPETAEWEVDSDEAYEAAFAAAELEGTPTGYAMVMETYVPASAPPVPAVTAFVWYVTFTMPDAEAESPVVAVDARTGEATVVE